MNSDVISTEIEYPVAKASSLSTGYRSKKPRACIKLLLADGSSRSAWVPSRVARQFVKTKPDFPAPLDTVKSAIGSLESKTALVYLTEMLGRRDHSSGEAKDKLTTAGYHDEAISYAIDRATSLRFLDDTRFAKFFIEERKRRGWGRRKIELELKRKKVPPEEIPGYPEDFFSFDDDKERAHALLSRKSIPENRPFEKLVRFLMGKGFSYSLASDVVKEYLSEE